MTTTRRFVCDDLFRFNNVNLDVLTETVRGVRWWKEPALLLFAEQPMMLCVSRSTTWASTSSTSRSGPTTLSHRRRRVAA